MEYLFRLLYFQYTSRDDIKEKAPENAAEQQRRLENPSRRGVAREHRLVIKKYGGGHDKRGGGHAQHRTGQRGQAQRSRFLFQEMEQKSRVESRGDRRGKRQTADLQ